MEVDHKQTEPSKSSSRSKDACVRSIIICLLRVPGAIGNDPVTHSLATRAHQRWMKNHTSLSVPAIPRAEFLERQSKLCHVLQDENIDALIAEPSATTLYYANISSYELSERPFLILFTKDCGMTYLAPKFEVGRIKGMAAVSDSLEIVEWAETDSPYLTLLNQTKLHNVMVDDATRYMIINGLTSVGMKVRPMSATVRAIRAAKSDNEVRILEAINKFTVDVIRAIQKELTIGTPRKELESALKSLFVRAGVGEGFWAIVLYGPQAASPHGGNIDGGLEKLKGGEFVLIDIGSTLHGYGSDVTRTILPDSSVVSQELWDKWTLVHDSQSAAISNMYENKTCSSVDEASRSTIRAAGWGRYYTHRLGHGLGLEMHEHPYLNGANDERLSVGNVVTNEPGIYVTTEQAGTIGLDKGFGVRIEDAVLVTAGGPRLMTGSRAKSPYEP
ncbi:protein of unknown function [Taphrina deformans PYCC 5710]|uniref:Peptidase M24 domain-containing protein n=1 Tax=Taphrina deformans (strain PYCC 5710 / ATCC 11124 / CBS 356.35 / IMI 108563 / JCM 9778 / NBRC 8474) TaxID=1097556 RepID=R4XGW0_TAPDE|nr:protein of unknown function [Taphrina deformans PYCC 5710]|eukprot:CCG83738.1 protein of unknown function [Taphrina deformans PYCC 5710]